MPSVLTRTTRSIRLPALVKRNVVWLASTVCWRRRPDAVVYVCTMCVSDRLANVRPVLRSAVVVRSPSRDGRRTWVVPRNTSRESRPEVSSRTVAEIGPAGEREAGAEVGGGGTQPEPRRPQDLGGAPEHLQGEPAGGVQPYRRRDRRTGGRGEPPLLSGHGVPLPHRGDREADQHRCGARPQQP